MKRILALLSLFLIPLATADDFAESHRAAALEFLEASQSRSLYETGLVEGLEMEMAAMPQMEAYRGVFEKWQGTYLSWDKIEADYIAIICNAFTEQEIKTLIDFYSTPIGKKQLEKSGEIAIESLKLSQKLAARYQPELEVLLRKRAAEIEAEVEQLFPELGPSEPGEKAPIIIHSSHQFLASEMKELVYPLPAGYAATASEFTLPQDETPLSAVQALGKAYDAYYAERSINSDEFWQQSECTLKRFEWRDEDSEELRSVWFYVVRCSVFASQPVFGMPPEIVVLMDGAVIEPKKR